MTRPTTDRIKETLFNILAADIPGCRFLDLFAGSGGIGIEALSRGAAQAVFIEKSRAAAAVIKANLDFTRLSDRGEIITADVMQAIAKLNEQGRSFDVIFMDPPYNKLLEKQAMAALLSGKTAAPQALIVAEASIDTDFSYLKEWDCDLVRVKTYKTNQHVFIRKR